MRRVDAEHLHLTAVATAESLEDLDRRALAGTVRPEQRDDLPGGDMELELVDNRPFAVSLLQSADFDDVVHDAFDDATNGAGWQHLVRELLSTNRLTAVLARVLR